MMPEKGQGERAGGHGVKRLGHKQGGGGEWVPGMMVARK